MPAADHQPRSRRAPRTATAPGCSAPHQKRSHRPIRRSGATFASATGALTALLVVTVALSFYGASRLPHQGYEPNLNKKEGRNPFLGWKNDSGGLRPSSSSGSGADRRSGHPYENFPLQVEYVPFEEEESWESDKRVSFPLQVAYVPFEEEKPQGGFKNRRRVVTVSYWCEALPLNFSGAVRPRNGYHSLSSDEDLRGHDVLNSDDYESGDSGEEENGGSDEDESGDNSSGDGEEVVSRDDQYHSVSSDEDIMPSGENGDKLIEGRDLLSEVDEDGCVPMKEWMVRPVRETCNHVMEIDMVEAANFVIDSSETPSFTFSDGLGKKDEVMQMTIQMLEPNGINPKARKRMQKDTKIMDQLKSSPYVLNIYGFCSASQIIEYSSGSVNDLVKEWRLNNEDYKTTALDRLRIGAQIARGIADLHSIEGAGAVPSVAQNNLCGDEVVRVGDVYKISSFHLSKLLRKDAVTGQTCLEEVPYCMKKVCSPEQYEGKATGKLVLSPPNDIFAVGNIFYYLLTNRWVFEGISDAEVRIKLRNGERSPFPDRVLASSDPAEVALRKAVDMCWVHDPQGRPNARELSDFFLGELDKLDGGSARREGVVLVPDVPKMGADHRYTDNNVWDNLEFRT